MIHPDSPLWLSKATEAAQAAGEVLSRYFGKSFQVNLKKNAGLVTPADQEAEAVAKGILKRAFPEFDILAEESFNPKDGKFSSYSEGRWIIDPLDGTTNFVHGFPMFCVSIALEVHGKLEVGVIYHPIFKELYVARRGGGAFLNETPIKVSQTSKLENALLTTGFSYTKGPQLQKEIRHFKYLSEIARGIRRPGSAALDLAYTARGVFDGFWERGLSPWDIAAGALLVEEAGGKVSNFEGGPFQKTWKEIVASNSHLYPKLVRHLEMSPVSKTIKSARSKRRTSH